MKTKYCSFDHSSSYYIKYPKGKRIAPAEIKYSALIAINSNRQFIKIKIEDRLQKKILIHKPFLARTIQNCYSGPEKLGTFRKFLIS